MEIDRPKEALFCRIDSFIAAADGGTGLVATDWKYQQFWSW
jgi:hypothetical protein